MQFAVSKIQDIILAKRLGSLTAWAIFNAAYGIQFAYRRPGTRDGTPLIFLQHFTGNMDSWDPVAVDSLAASRPVIVFGNTGVVKSSGKAPDNVAPMAADIEQFTAALGFAEVDLLGFSQRIRRPLTTRPLASFMRVLQSFGFFILALGRRSPTLVRTVVEQMERGCASFADVPYQDAQTRRDLVQMLDELEETPR